jgi:hypothetical protein
LILKREFLANYHLSRIYRRSLANRVLRSLKDPWGFLSFGVAGRRLPSTMTEQPQSLKRVMHLKVASCPSCCAQIAISS